MRAPLNDTLKRTLEPERAETEGPAHAPGLVLIFSGGRPCAQVLPLDGNQQEIGREHPALSDAQDPRISRRHVRITYDGRHFSAIDLGSSNGTIVDGVAASVGRTQILRRFIRLGDSLFIPIPDVESFAATGVKVEDGRVLGPALQAVVASAERAAQTGETLHISGESGVGKEGVARVFHEAGRGQKGRFVAVNCATIPESIAERILFGAKRGAYSGADADAEGYVQAADGGTLFLDEIAELNLAVQAKLLRVLENKEILPVGATRLRMVTLQVCSATHQDLRAQVLAGRLREDLYFRIAQPEVSVPPLRQRLEEIPWLIQSVAQRTAKDLPIHVSLVESCLKRSWPGNIRELLAAVRSAAQAAVAEAAARIEGKHLSSTAGAAWQTLAEEPPGPSQDRSMVPSRAPAIAPATAPDRAAIEEALARSSGNISLAARQLNVHRTQLHRWLSRYGISVPRSKEEN